MVKKLISLVVLVCWLHTFTNGQTGIFMNNKDIGSPKLEGSGVFDTATQGYTLRGGGSNIWGQRDEFRYLFNKIKGDFILTANFAFEGVNEVHRKTGWMVRADESDDAVMCGGFLHGDGLTAMQWRERKGAEMIAPADEIRATKKHYQVIQLERSGRQLIMRVAHEGEPLQVVGSKVMDYLPDEVMAGLVICSHDAGVVETAHAWNVRIDKPVAAGNNSGPEGSSGCRMEILDVFNGMRQVIFEKNSRFEAPNWMPDGKRLLFNMDGSVFTVPVAGGDPVRLNTGDAKQINNDHCISFDGKMLGISCNTGKGSNVLVLPLEGGNPKEVTSEAPSYLHGWSPDNRQVVYVAQRNGGKIYNIYRKPIGGGTEVALTANKSLEHVDGCEYSPDGKYIYYNGNQHGGTMQIWRMKPDGSAKEQLTFGACNAWFPHVSPDGRWIAFISFPPDIELNSHPALKRVTLNLMPAGGGAPRIIAYLYGGQGTFNVNSWSPDSRHLAFVSNYGRP